MMNSQENALEKGQFAEEQAAAESVAEVQNTQETVAENVVEEAVEVVEETPKAVEEAAEVVEKAAEEAMAPLHEKLGEAIAKMAKKNGLALVVNTDSRACPFIDPDMGVDLQDEVSKLLNR